jgi:hypothetical protein
MTVGTKKHITLGSYTFEVDEENDNHYVHSIEGLLQPSYTGNEGKRQLRDDLLLWEYTDWSGGEGNLYYDPADPTKYNYSEPPLNGRIKGRLTGRPGRTIVDVTYDDQRIRPNLAVADNALWVAGNATVAYTTDGATWSPKTGSSAKITAIAGDHDYLYWTSWVTSASGTRIIRRASVSGAAADVVASATGKNVYAGMVIANQGRLYAWTGKKLFEHDIFESLPLASDKVRKVYDTGGDNPSGSNYNAYWWANCLATENSVVMWYSTDGRSNVYEFKYGIGRPIWNPSYGFTIKSATYSTGILYFWGHWGGDSNQSGYGAGYALPLDTRRPIFLGWFRKNQGSNLQMQESTGSYGAQVLVAAARTGRIFAYDPEFDAISLVDDLETVSSELDFTNNDNRIGDMITYGLKRYSAVYQPGAVSAGTVIQMVEHDPDDEGSQEENTTGTLYNPEWDNGYPFTQKSLMGFHVSFVPLVANQSIVVSYSLDGASYVDLTALTSATTGNAGGRVWQAVSSTSDTLDYTKLKFKVTLASTSASTNAPVLLGLAAESRLRMQEETWTIDIKVKDQYGRNRVPGQGNKGFTIRDWLNTVTRAQDVVSFVDGYASVRPDDADTYSVTIDRLDDVIVEPGEGTCRIFLRKVRA